jgi:ankyrin repeat protein
MLASAEGKVDVVKYLIRKGATTKAFDSEGNTVILIAAQQQTNITF